MAAFTRPAQRTGNRQRIEHSREYVQIRQGRLLIDRHSSNAHLFSNTSRVIEAVQKLRNHELDHLDLRIIEHSRGGAFAWIVEQHRELRRT
ncbi:hypothetical protein [Bradyrhizobium sp. S3.12.5]|uniref:hypothetical protein n=1 Tax=Bradyrhizobium sp. S3.12.5 TaxID=3156386 RepID=UPI0033921C79